MAQALVMAKNLTTGRAEAMTKLKVDNANGQLISTTTGGTAPMSIVSTTVVPNLNVDQVDGYHATDLFNLDNSNVSGILDTDHGGTDLNTSASTGVPSISGGTWSVNALLPASLGGTGLDTSGSTGVPYITTGTWATETALDETRGGTAQTSYTAGDILYASASDTLAKLGIGSNGDVLTLAAGLPSWAAAGAPGAHAASHSENAGDEILVENLGTATLSTGSFLTTDGTGGVTMLAGDLPPVSTAQYSILVADASAGWVEDTGFKVNGGVVGTGTWQGAAVGTPYGGTGQNSSLWIGFPYFSSAGTWARTDTTIAAGDMVYASAINTLAHLAKGTSYQTLRMNVGATAPEWGTSMPLGGGTGLTGYTAGDIIYASGTTTLAKLAKGTADQFLRMNAGATAPEWDTINLDNLANVADMTEVQGDVLYYNGSNWNRLPAGASGNFLMTQGGSSNPIWADAGTGYTWTLAGDTGSETIADTNTASFLGGNGIVTAVTATDTCTISAVSDVTTGGDTAPVLVATNGLGLDVSALAGVGIAADGSAALDIDTASTVGFGAASAWTFPNGVTAKGLFVTGTPVDGNHVTNKTYVDNLVTGLTWKDPASCMQYIGTRTIVQINALSPVSGDTVVAGDAGTPTAGSSDALTVGDVAEYNGTEWKEIVNASGGYPPAGTRLVVHDDPVTLYSPLTEGVDEGKIAEFGGTSLTPSLTSPSDGWALLVIGEGSVNENIGFTYDNASWIQFTGAGQINAGTALTKSGNTLNVGSGSTGNINGLSFGADSLGAAVDNSTIEISSNVLRVKPGGIGTTELDLTMSPTWTGLHTFAHASGIQTDDIIERTGAAGVTIDSLLIKDGYATVSEYTGNIWNSNNTGLSIGINELVASDTIDSDVQKANASAANTASIYGVCNVTTANGQPCPLYQTGPHLVKFVGGLSGYTPGDPVYLSLTAGHATFDVSVFVSSNVVVQVGWLQDDTGLSATTVLGETATVLLDIHEGTVLA